MRKKIKFEKQQFNRTYDVIAVERFTKIAKEYDQCFSEAINELMWEQIAIHENMSIEEVKRKLWEEEQNK